MTYYAKIENGIVTKVIVCDNIEIKNYSGKWIETKMASNYAGIGFTWSTTKNKFIPQKPFESWIPFEDKWKSPKQYPLDGQLYKWNEANQEWVIKGQNGK